MPAPAPKTEAPKAAAARAPQGPQPGPAPVADNRPQAVAQRQMQDRINQSARVQQAAARQARIAQSPRQQPVAQHPAATAPAPAQLAANRTGLPDELKAGVENLSGHSLDDVRVHYNSARPAELQAHAYAQGTDIHVAPGQEEHLPHEAWHVVQQKQGRVRPTRQLKGKVPVNDDAGLEREADVMGAASTEVNGTKAMRGISSLPTSIVQRTVDTDLEEADVAMNAADGYANDLSEPIYSYMDKITYENESGDDERAHLAANMARGFKVWAENYNNKTQAYLYEAQKANDFSNGLDRHAILGADTDENPDLEIQRANGEGGWSSKAVEFKASTSPNYEAMVSLVRKGLIQLEKREVARDSYDSPYSQLLLTVHNGNLENPYPMTPHMINVNYAGEIENVTEADWDLRLTELLNGQIIALDIQTPIEIRLEHNGLRYATASYNQP